jgi:dTDP-4-dehydrorhamnose reductase
MDTVTGANIAATLADRQRVIGVSHGSRIEVGGCRSVECAPGEIAALVGSLAGEGAVRIIYCGPGADSVWHGEADSGERALAAIEPWIDAARRFEIPMTLISSDSVFTSPWMFHAEECGGRCPTEPARIIREIEQRVAASLPGALIVRTHAFGWGHPAGRKGWIEHCVDVLEHGHPHDFDYIRHATPILASELAELLDAAHQNGLEGVYHIAGAERINPVQFASRLAERLGLAAPRPAAKEMLTQCPSGFGRGETSLQTRKIRSALGRAVPMLADGLERLVAERENGYRDRLAGWVPATVASLR